MAVITAAVLYLSSRLVLWMRFLYLDVNELQGFPVNRRVVTIQNIALFYFPIIDLCFLVYTQYYQLDDWGFLSKLNEIKHFR